MSQFDLAQVAGICEHCQPSSLASQEYSHRIFFFFFEKERVKNENLYKNILYDIECWLFLT